MSSLSRPIKHNNSYSAYKIRPSSSDKCTLPLLHSSKKFKYFNGQDQVYIHECGNTKSVESEAMKQTIHSCIIPLTFIHPSTQQFRLGTAFLISPNIAMTSAHNIYNKSNNKYHWEVKLCPTLAGQAKHDYQIQDIFLPEQFIMESETQHSTLFDYAFIKLKEPIMLPGYLLPTINFNSDKQTLAIYGYPGSQYRKQGNTVKVQQHGLQRQNDIIWEDEDRELKRLRYKTSTEKGQSGCPVVIGRGERNQVIAIHKGGSEENQFNYGRLITRDMIINLEIWRNQCRGAQFKCYDYSKGAVFNFREKYKDQIRKGIAAKKKKKGLINSPRWSQKPILKEIKKNEDGFIKQQESSEFVLANLIRQIKDVIVTQLVKPSQDRKKPHPRPNPRIRRNVFDYFKKPSFWNEQTRYAQQFSIHNKIATKNNNNGMFQITSSQPISSDSKIIFIVHSYNKNIILGLTKSSTVNLPYSGGQNMKGSIALSTNRVNKMGKIIINGQVKAEKKGFFIEPGESLTIEVNTKLWYILFTTTTAKSFAYTLDEQFCNDEWFIFASLKQERDRIEVIM